MKSAVFALAANVIQAEAIVDELRLSGFSNADISILFPEKKGTGEPDHVRSLRAPEGVLMGAGTGGILGEIAGWLLGLGTIALPETAPLIAAGPIFAALSGVVLGGAAGGLSGALAGLGFPEYEARLYAGKLEKGNILIAAHTENGREAKTARQIFEQADANDIGVTPEPAVSR